ncbi:MAG: sigma-54-dependent Fis family transcriptional regulator [Persephonella sp.]|nr:MAG: sigma-54-dependent Fis family transcriptional regulator [Persephonella sp.]
MCKGRILLVDDNLDFIENFQEILEDEGFKVKILDNPFDALEILKNTDFDLVISDMKMPKMDGYQFLKELRKFNKTTSFIVLTGYGTVENAVKCMKEGAFHYFEKPLDFYNPKIWKIIDEAIQKSKLLKENLRLKEQIKILNFKDIEIITNNDEMLNLLEQIKKISQLDITVLIQGESGVGKELFAKAIHNLSPRKDKPFIPINCANISKDIMEAEFFGYKKGAFTGAESDRKGIIEMADGGTLFLDEIGELPLDIQGKFLRFLQNREVRRIGSDKIIIVDVRIIAATNKDLKKLVKEGKFREDLYYRIANFVIKVPPLRERKEDIPLLVNYFIDKFNKLYGTNIKGITLEALKILINYDWEGNVRQLENVIQRACILADSDDFIKAEHLDMEIVFSSKNSNFPLDYSEVKKTFTERFMRSYLKTLLSMTNGNITQSAKLANIERQSLQKLLKKYNINAEDFRNR